MWRGLGSDEAEEAAANYVANYLGGSLEEVKEGDESGKPETVAVRVLDPTPFPVKKVQGSILMS